MTGEPLAKALASREEASAAALAEEEAYYAAQGGGVQYRNGSEYMTLSSHEIFLALPKGLPM